MKNNKILSTSLSLGLSLALLIGNVSGNVNNVKAKEQGEKKQIYMIQAFSEEKLDEIEHKYSIAETSAVENADSVSTIYLTAQEAKELNENEKNLVVEKDKVMHGLGEKTNFDLTDEQWNLKMIHANEKTETVVKDKIKVAIIDSGIDYSDDIQVAERKNFVPDEDKVSVLYEDGSGHGTSVAGIIAAKDNQVGITGINDNVELYSAKVLDRNNQAPISRVIQAIDWAVEKQVNIINMSLGVSSYSSALHEAVKRAKQKGILVVTAAGNGGKIEYPAAFKETIAVGSIGPDGKVSEASAIGNMLDLVAPGEQILSTSAFEGVMASGGTSMAAPHVTGIASVLWEQDKNVSADFIKYLLCVTAKKLGDETKYGNGIVDLQYALSHYDELKKQYKESKKSQDVFGNSEIDSVNDHDLETFDDVDIVEGRWSKADHQKLADKASSIAGPLTAAELAILKKGIVAQDNYLVYKGTDASTAKYQSLHGYSNYVNAYEYIMKMALKCKKTSFTEAKKVSYINNNTYDVADCKNINNSITAALVKKVLNGSSYDKKNCALVLMGMAMHVVSDTYAHRAYVPGNPYWTHITHSGGADNSTNAIGEKRYKASSYALGEVLAIWNGNCPPSFQEYDLIGIYNHSSSFRLINYNAYSSRCENGIDYSYYASNVKKLSCKYISEGKGAPE